MFPPSTTCPKPTTSTRRTTPATERSPSNSSSSSNRSSIASSNSSGYCSAGVLLQHPFHQFHHQPPPLAATTSSVHPSAVRRTSNQSNASGTSTSPSAQRLALQSLKSPDVSVNGGCVNEETDENAAQEHGTADLYQQGRKEAELLYKWLESINQTDCFHLFLQSGYDMHTVSRMTPEDLTAIGITFPSVRKRLAIEISRLQIPDGIPNFWPSSVQEWLQYIHLQCYYDTLMKENYTNLEKVMEITWEDLEDIGIKQLGHQKKIILAIDKLKKIHASKIISSSYSSTTTPFPNNLFQLENSMQSFRKNSPLACHELIVEQIDAKNRNKEKKLPITLRSPEIVHLKSIEIPAPEIVAIQVCLLPNHINNFVI
ncbi:hypothetical protein HELRODRAFT_105246 [Helobdella robusta]|uniref:SAM domain-containing protein n=1 Tax=Helobdella robusta TaxID=6412 RepID=T1EDS1_HELRO|nr:hypothetical protein HELRODRAFT_105246 [Helobdella robusta]ESO12239.1 hypothetical protein HELRODRAFT_105246 [Helobdella robusta]